MHSMTLGEIARITGGVLHGEADLIITSVTTDTRDVLGGALFGAIIGERVDGHNFVDDALTSGAVAVLSTRKVEAPCVVVKKADHIDGVIVALGELAKHERSLLTDVNVIGVTGSSGKTSTKDIIGQVLAHHASTCAPAGSPNNELGLPMTILNAPAQTKYLVLEMGMRGLGHIQYLCEIAQPTIAVVTNVGVAHIGEVGSLAAIVAAKAELIEALPSSGVAILNADDQNVAGMSKRTRARVVTYGVEQPADISVSTLKVSTDASTTFTVNAMGESASVSLPLMGLHNVSNALAAIAVGLNAGMTLQDCAAALNSVELKSKWRMERHNLKNNIVLINDAYNANPDSMRAAISALAALAHAHERWLVVAGMHELGPDSDAMHSEIGNAAALAGIEHVIVIGETARPIASSAGERAVWVPNRESACDYIEKNISQGDAILIKASRSEGLEMVAEELMHRIGRATV